MHKNLLHRDKISALKIQTFSMKTQPYSTGAKKGNIELVIQITDSFSCVRQWPWKWAGKCFLRAENQ